MENDNEKKDNYPIRVNVSVDLDHFYDLYVENNKDVSKLTERERILAFMAADNAEDSYILSKGDELLTEMYNDIIKYSGDPEVSEAYSKYLEEQEKQQK